MAAHYSILAWRLLWTEVPGRLQSMGSQRVRHDSATEHEHSPQSLEVGLSSPHLQDEGPYPTK